MKKSKSNLHHLTEQLRELLNKHPKALESAMPEIREIVNKLDSDLIATGINLNLHDAAPRILNAFDEDQKEKYAEDSTGWQKNYMETGFRELNQLIYGFLPGEFVIIGGRQGMGKTTLMVQLANDMSHQFPSLFLTTEQSTDKLIMRLLGNLSNIETSKLLHNDLTLEQMPKLWGARNKNSTHNLWINAIYGKKNKEFFPLIREAVQSFGIKLVFIDYLQMLPDMNYHTGYKYPALSVSLELMDLARELDCCIVAASQLNNQIETRPGLRIPNLSDIKLAWDEPDPECDKVILLYRSDYYNMSDDEYGFSTKNNIDLIVALNKTGHTGTITLKRNNEFTRITD